METLLAIERHFAESSANLLEPEAFSRWRATRSGHRLPIHKHKQLLVYTVKEGKPVILDRLTLRSLAVDLSEGIKSTWNSNYGDVVIGHMPHEVAEGCFMWHNIHSTIDYIRLFELERGVRIAMTWRTTRNPDDVEEGVTYLIETGAYRRKWGNE
jgi:hypothetical protein